MKQEETIWQKSNMHAKPPEEFPENKKKKQNCFKQRMCQ